MISPNNHTIEPSYDLWGSLLLENIKRKKNYLRHPLADSIRIHAIAAAVNYTNKLVEIGLKNNLKISIPSFKDNNRNLIATGHQPTIYHDGITAKYDLIKRFCDQHNAIGLNLLVDTDSGDACEFNYPKLINNKVVIAKASMVHIPDTVFVFQKISSLNKINAVKDEVFSALKHLSIPVNIIQKVFEMYAAFSNNYVASTNSIVRRCFRSESNYYDLPLSALIEIPDVKDYFLSYLFDYKNFYNHYNSKLDQFRKLNTIENTANPFPNLRAIKDFRETPFWLIDKETGKKFSLFIRETGSKYFFSDELSQIVGVCEAKDIKNFLKNYYLSPKAFLISVLLKTILSDLFIHGKGGAAYDKFTDYFLKSLYEESYSFVTVSRDSYLFASEYDPRQIMFHPEKFELEKILTPHINNRFRNVLGIKNSLLLAIENSLTKKGKTYLFQKIKRCNNLMIKIIIKNLRKGYSVDKDVRSFREFPYFFFPK